MTRRVCKVRGRRGPWRWPDVVLLVALASGAACTDALSPAPAPDATTANFTIVAGNGQTGEVGVELPQPLVVIATASDGKPLAGITINFRVISGGGSVYAGTATTNSQGQAQDFWTLGTRTRIPQTLEVRAVDATTGAKSVFATFAATATSGPPVAVYIGPAYMGMSDRAEEAVYQLPDADGASAEGLLVRHPPYVVFFDRYSNRTSVGASATFRVSAGGGTLAATVVPADSEGVSAPAWTLGAPGKQELIVTVPSTIESTLQPLWIVEADSMPHYSIRPYDRSVAIAFDVDAYPTAGLTLVASPTALTDTVGSVGSWYLHLADQATGNMVLEGFNYEVEAITTNPDGTKQTQWMTGPLFDVGAYSFGNIFTLGTKTSSYVIYGIGSAQVTVTGS